jgi:ABC-2 type transport system ATP-binding protein
MKRRLLIAKALVHQPPIIILDEPTAGVDVELRKNLWKNVKSLNKQGVTIILTTHNLSEAEEMCNRIGILNKGILVALDSTKNLLDKIKTKKITFKLSRNIDLNSNIGSSLNVISNKDNEVVISYEKNKITTGEIINLIQKQNVKIIDISTDDGDLEDIFIRLTKN